MHRYSAGYLRQVATDIFAACGAPLDEAAIVAEQLVSSNLVGIDSHGVIRIPLYWRWIREGNIKPGGLVSVIREQGGTATVDCGYNFGQIGGLRAMEVAIAKAKEHGVACVLTQRCNHVGRLGYFTQMAADAGLFALATCNSPRNGHYVVPFGGREGRLATNPISYAAPGREFAIVSDISTSTTAEGKVRLYRNRGQKLPQGCIIDGAGRPSVDPEDFYSTPRGWLLPLGGSFGYKGFALGLLVEILSGTLAGDLVTEYKRDGNNGACFIVVDISAFIPLERFRELIGEMVAYMKSAPPAPGFEEVMLPGEIDFRIATERQRDGIPIDPITWQQIQETADALQVRIREPW
jgi:uncharacterized oxidoreductase